MHLCPLPYSGCHMPVDFCGNSSNCRMAYRSTMCNRGKILQLMITGSEHRRGALFSSLSNVGRLWLLEGDGCTVHNVLKTSQHPAPILILTAFSNDARRGLTPRISCSNIKKWLYGWKLVVQTSLVKVCIYILDSMIEIVENTKIKRGWPGTIRLDRKGEDVAEYPLARE